MNTTPKINMPSSVNNSIVTTSEASPNNDESTYTAQSSGNSKYKSYLIEKLLNESTVGVDTAVGHHLDNLNNHNHASSRQYNGGYDLIDRDADKSLPAEEDARSEAGTYTIDENVPGDVAVLEDLEFKENRTLKATKIIENSQIADSAVSKSITSPSIVELASARAAIDQTFGVRRLIESESAGEITQLADNPSSKNYLEIMMASQPVKRTPQKVVRQRNKTYSLRKEVLDGIETNFEEDESNKVALETQELSNSRPEKGSKVFLLSSSSSSASSNSSTSMPENSINIQQLQQTYPSSSSSDMKKTTTYEVIAEINNSSQLNEIKNPTNNMTSESARSATTNVGTDLLLGDTEKLIEQLKLRRFEKTKQLKTKLLTANSACFQVSQLNSVVAPIQQSSNNNQDIFSTSSASSSSTNLSNTNEPKSQRNCSSKSNKTSIQAWIIPTEKILISPEGDTATASTRATVNFSLNSNRTTEASCNENIPNGAEHSTRASCGGLAFDYFLDKSNDNHPDAGAMSFRSVNSDSLANSSSADANSTLTTMTLTKRFEMRKAAAAAAAAARKKNTSSHSDLDSSSTITASSLASPKYSAVSLGAKIAEKARLNGQIMVPTTCFPNSQPSQQRRASENGLGNNTLLGMPSSLTATPVQYTNRTLALRQESAKAKRNSLEKTSQKTSSSGILKKTSTTLNNSLNKSNSGVLPGTPGRALSSSGGKVGTNGVVSKSTSRSNSQTRHGNSSGSNQTMAHVMNTLMTGSLNLTSGMHLPSSPTSNDSFQRRKMYDPMRAVEKEKLRRQQQLQSQSSHQQTLSRNSNIKLLNGSNEKLYDPNLSFVDSETGDDEPIDPSKLLSRSLTTKTLNTSNEPNMNSCTVETKAQSNNHYEKIMQSTLQRLCIRLIQVSTGVLDKIGDNSLGICDSIQFTNATTELERMQSLAKLVHSMQLIHDHIQLIDSAVFNNKSEESYIKELSKIRQEVDILKQSAGLNSPSSSSHNTNSKLI